MRISIAFGLALAAVLPVFGGDQLSIVAGSDEFEFIYRVKLPAIDGKARLWMPLAKTDAFQSVRVDEISIPIKWEKVRDRDYGNDICVLNLQTEDSGKVIELRYRVLRKEKTAYATTDLNVGRYLRPETLVPVSQTFKAIAEQAISRKTNDIAASPKLRKTAPPSTPTTPMSPKSSDALSRQSAAIVKGRAPDLTGTNMPSAEPMMPRIGAANQPLRYPNTDRIAKPNQTSISTTRGISTAVNTSPRSVAEPVSLTTAKASATG